nr:hypothetical protein [Escherichia coli]
MTYTATVQANLSWSVDVPASALQALGNGELTISASVTNSVGNTGNGTREITIDANLPGLRIDTVAGDDVVNIIEHGQALVITGSSSDLAAGSNVTLTINGQTYVEPGNGVSAVVQGRVLPSLRHTASVAHSAISR